jgi:mono/diheme cytochrome c family protein
MMKKIMRWTSLIFGGLIGLLVIVLVAANVLSYSRTNRLYSITSPAIIIPNDEAALARGEHLVEVVSHCAGCHGPDLGGYAFFDDPSLGTIPGSNLTSGKGGVGTYYTDEDWIRALLHGIAPDGRMLMIMPSQYFRHYSDEDLGAVIAYLKQIPPVDREFPTKRLALMGSTFFGLGFFGSMPAEIIDHISPRPPAPLPGVTSAYGEYLVNIAVCKDCHGENLAGSRPGPDAPWGSNLTPGGALANWSEDDFFNVMRTGMTPAGRALIPFMPWQEYGKMTDEELQAIWMYLESLPAAADNPR